MGQGKKRKILINTNLNPFKDDRGEIFYTNKSVFMETMGGDGMHGDFSVFFLAMFIFFLYTEEVLGSRSHGKETIKVTRRDLGSGKHFNRPSRNDVTLSKTELKFEFFMKNRKIPKISDQ